MMMARVSSNLGDLLTGTLSKTNETIIRELLENWADPVQRKETGEAETGDAETRRSGDGEMQ